MTSPRVRFQSATVRGVSLLPTVATLLFCATILVACDDPVPLEAPYVHVRILQPADSLVTRDSVLRVKTDLQKNCGCQARVEFWVDGTLEFTDFVPDYSFDWDVHDLAGWHTVMAHGIVDGRADGRDSVRIFVAP